MKRFLVVTFAGLMLMGTVTGCGKKEEDSGSVGISSVDKEDKNDADEDNDKNENENNSASDESEEAALSSQETDDGEGLSQESLSEQTVEIIFPAEAFVSTSEENISKQAANMGATARINDDGSVVYIMTEAKRKEVFEGLKTDLKDSCDMLVSNGKYAFLKEISFDENMENIIVKVDRAAYEAQEDITFGSIERQCLGCQVYNLVKAEDAVVTLHITDETSGEEFYTEKYNKDGVIE